MLNTIVLNIEEIYVPTKRRKELDPQRVETVAEEVMEEAEDVTDVFEKVGTVDFGQTEGAD